MTSDWQLIQSHNVKVNERRIKFKIHNRSKSHFVQGRVWKSVFMRCKLTVPRWRHRGWPKNVTSGKPALKVEPSFFLDPFLENYLGFRCVGDSGTYVFSRQTFLEKSLHNIFHGNFTYAIIVNYKNRLISEETISEREALKIPYTTYSILR